MALATASQEVCKKLYCTVDVQEGGLEQKVTRHAGVAVTSQRGGFSGFAHTANPGFLFLIVLDF